MNPITHTYTNMASAAFAAETESRRFTELLGKDVLVTYEQVAPGAYILVVPTLPVPEPVLVCGDDGVEGFDHPDATGLQDVDAAMEDDWFDAEPAFTRSERVFMESPAVLEVV